MVGYKIAFCRKESKSNLEFSSYINVQSYLSPEDFRKIFGMDSTEFYELPKWKQDMQKRARDLF